MQKLSCVFFVLISLSCFAQKNPKDKALLDSLIKSDDLMRMLDSLDKPSSYLKLNVGIGNRLFSVRNNSINSLQSDNKLVLTPSIGYYHKSGFSIAFAGYLLSDSGKTNFYQSSLTPAFDYETGETINTGISYTRYFSKGGYNGSISPIQNDIYAYINLKKLWVKPQIALGYSTGTYKEINMVTVNLPVLGTKTFPDTATTKLKAFSLIGSVEHTFNFYELISKRDYASLTTGFIINSGSGKYEVTHKNRYSASVNNRRGRVKTKQTDNSKFQLQSLAVSFDFSYAIGKFNFEPQLYLDYYLPATTDKKFTQVYSINIGFTF